MKTWVPLLLGCMLVATSHAQSRREVYEWTDADGVKHFSDYPQPGARKITLNGSPSTTTAPPVVATPSSPSRPEAPPEAQYQALEIISPLDQSSFFEVDDEIDVRVRAQPELGSDDRLVTYLDNKELGDLNATEHRISGLSRGAHILQSAIYGRDGKEKIRSPKITFFMKQTADVNPRNQGPALRPPPPKPTPRPTPRSPGK
jgi:hypothetical protein